MNFDFRILNFYHMPSFYLARCADGTLYAGACKDLASRAAQHNAGKGAKYTRSRLPIEMVYHEEYETLSEALKREAQVKKMRRSQKELLIKQR